MNYEKLDLKNDDDLKQACETVREKRPDWKAEIVAFLQEVQNADEEARAVSNSIKNCGTTTPL